MKRWPRGIREESYFQKQAPKGLPDWVKTKQFRTHPREVARLVDFVLVNDERTLLSMVQLNCVDMNAWYSRVDKPHRPDFVLFDLDPPEGLWRKRIEVAHLIRGRLDELGLESHVKTSGSTGIHVLVPIARRSTFEDTYDFAELVSRGLGRGARRADHGRVAEEEAPRRARRSQAERLGQDDRLGVLGATAARRAGLDPAPLEGAGEPDLTSATSRWTSCSSACRSTATSSSRSARDAGASGCASRGQEERCRALCRSARRASPRRPSQIGVGST